ncbi:hypothetical protein [Streptomyces sp. NPDC001530]|uniref:MmyB family transcriptional regulator n=1 Tax=Streptomyces sp. NPDC001530 TaxID=3364582 RepID=UPI003683580C
MPKLQLHPPSPRPHHRAAQPHDRDNDAALRLHQRRGSVPSHRLTHKTRMRRFSTMLRHPVVGDLTLDWDALGCVNDPGRQLDVWTAEPGTPSRDGLGILVSRSAEGTRSVSGTAD